MQPYSEIPNREGLPNLILAAVGLGALIALGYGQRLVSFDLKDDSPTSSSARPPTTVAPGTSSAPTPAELEETRARLLRPMLVPSSRTALEGLTEANVWDALEAMQDEQTKLLLAAIFATELRMVGFEAMKGRGWIFPTQRSWVTPTSGFPLETNIKDAVFVLESRTDLLKKPLASITVDDFVPFYVPTLMPDQRKRAESAVALLKPKEQR